VIWLAVWTVAAAAGVVGLVVSANSLRFRRRVAREVRQMWAGGVEPRRVGPSRWDGLPAPVRRYLAKAVRQGAHAARTVRLRHGGTFRPKLDGSWQEIRGEEYFAADPPGFIWWGRVPMAPGVWIEARDRSVGGAGHMLVLAESTFTLADVAGPEMDQGALLRLLAELPWMPTVFLDDRHVTWAALDDGRARATLRVNGREVAGMFEFGADGLPAAFAADRPRDTGGGESVLTPWCGRYADYRAIDGLLLPHDLVAAWQIDGREIPYARFQVERLELDATEPF